MGHVWYIMLPWYLKIATIATLQKKHKVRTFRTILPRHCRAPSVAQELSKRSACRPTKRGSVGKDGKVPFKFCWMFFKQQKRRAYEVGRLSRSLKWSERITHFLI